MIYEVRCKSCAKLMVHVDKPQITQEDIDMYNLNSVCDVCTDELLNKAKAFGNKCLRKLGLKK